MKYCIAFLTLAACAPAPPANPFSMQGCRAAEYGVLVGTPLAAVTLPADLNDRVVTIGSTVPPDRDPGRINFFVDENGVIESVACG